MPLTLQQIADLEAAALDHNDRAAVKALAAAAREHAADDHLYEIETADGMIRVVTARQYLSMTATDLSRAKIRMIRG